LPYLYSLNVLELEQRIDELAEAIESANMGRTTEPSTACFQPLSINIEDSHCSKSMPASPTEQLTFDFPRSHSVPPTPKVNVQSSTRIKNIVGLSRRKYGILRKELATEGINLPSPSTIQRNENRIFNEHYQNSDKPDFYGLIEKAVMKHDFSKLPNVRMTIGGDGGWSVSKLFLITKQIFRR
jgi:hypothetical protein